MRFSVEVISVYNLQATKSKEPHNLFFVHKAWSLVYPRWHRGPDKKVTLCQSGPNQYNSDKLCLANKKIYYTPQRMADFFRQGTLKGTEFIRRVKRNPTRLNSSRDRIQTPQITSSWILWGNNCHIVSPSFVERYLKN